MFERSVHQSIDELNGQTTDLYTGPKDVGPFEYCDVEILMKYFKRRKKVSRVIKKYLTSNSEFLFITFSLVSESVALKSTILHSLQNVTSPSIVIFTL